MQPEISGTNKILIGQRHAPAPEYDSCTQVTSFNQTTTTRKVGGAHQASAGTGPVLTRTRTQPEADKY